MSNEQEGGPVVVQDLGPWVIEMQWPKGATQGGPAVLVVRPKGGTGYPPGGISSTVLRQIDFKEAGEALRRQTAVSELRSEVRERYEADRTQRLKRAAAQGVTDEYLALLASAYVTYVNQGGIGPLAHLAERVGKSQSTVKGHLWQARKRGLLTGSAGRAGGALTEKASAILARIVPGAQQTNPDTRDEE
ncbi:hypothetical protein FRZ03_18630 [Streptomyces misionensis]|uniref:Uncharacterized protein n=1 Tax=Streptomyces misionensis TaxID=67331 RepID=A0A5C6JPL4_9ACTN|nr:hypothetical protein [Streptomyces misionensis]TWV43386.1 hypothetical protein FRZ03_18630 [Streptomyces misionensis]